MINHPINKLMILCKYHTMKEKIVPFRATNIQSKPSILEKNHHNEKIVKLQRLQKYQDSDFCEIGIDDGL